MTAALVVYMLAQPVFGMLADRFGRAPMLLLFGVGGMLVTVPVFSALAVASDPLVAFAIILVPLMLLSAYTSISALVKAELFPAHIRARRRLSLRDRQCGIRRHGRICRIVVQERARGIRLLLVCHAIPRLRDDCISDAAENEADELAIRN